MDPFMFNLLVRLEHEQREKEIARRWKYEFVHPDWGRKLVRRAVKTLFARRPQQPAAVRTPTTVKDC